MKKKRNFKNEGTYKDYKFDSLIQSFDNAKNFLDKNIKGILINNKNTNKPNEISKVSVIIPVFNSKNLINRSIKSIQNQDLKNFEIILVSDFSTDNTSYVIEKLAKDDDRIKIIDYYQQLVKIDFNLIMNNKYLFPIV